jgi:hypothetical protein
MVYYPSYTDYTADCHRRGQMITGKNCQPATTTQNGFVRNKPRDKCQACGDNFVRGEARHTRSTELTKALRII